MFGQPGVESDTQASDSTSGFGGFGAQKNVKFVDTKTKTARDGFGGFDKRKKAAQSTRKQKARTTRKKYVSDSSAGTTTVVPSPTQSSESDAYETQQLAPARTRPRKMKEQQPDTKEEEELNDLASKLGLPVAVVFLFTILSPLIFRGVSNSTLLCKTCSKESVMGPEWDDAKKS